MPSKPTNIERYLALLPTDQRAALQKLRTAIQSAAPKAVEGFSYGLPAFILDGKAIAGFAAMKNHLTYVPMSGAVVGALKDDLVHFKSSKGAIQFTHEKPLPAALVKKLVKCRLAEIAASSPSKANKSKPSVQAKIGKASKPSPASGEGAELARRVGASKSQRPSNRSARLPLPGDSDVDELLAGLDHPLKKEIQTVRKIILDISDSITDGVKWNSLSFRTTEWFATVNMRSTKELQLIFHLGAKVRKEAKTGVDIADPAGLAKWLAKDRCMVTLGSGKDLAAKRKPFEAFVREWIKVV